MSIYILNLIKSKLFPIKIQSMESSNDRESVNVDYRSQLVNFLLTGNKTGEDFKTKLNKFPEKPPVDNLNIDKEFCKWVKSGHQFIRYKVNTENPLKVYELTECVHNFVMTNLQENDLEHNETEPSKILLHYGEGKKIFIEKDQDKYKYFSFTSSDNINFQNTKYVEVQKDKVLTKADKSILFQREGEELYTLALDRDQEFQNISYNVNLVALGLVLARNIHNYQDFNVFSRSVGGIKKKLVKKKVKKKLVKRKVKPKVSDNNFEDRKDSSSPKPSKISDNNFEDRKDSSSPKPSKISDNNFQDRKDSSSPKPSKISDNNFQDRKDSPRPKPPIVFNPALGDKNASQKKKPEIKLYEKKYRLLIECDKYLIGITESNQVEIKTNLLDKDRQECFYELIEKHICEKIYPSFNVELKGRYKVSKSDNNLKLLPGNNTFRLSLDQCGYKLSSNQNVYKLMVDNGENNDQSTNEPQTVFKVHDVINQIKSYAHKYILCKKLSEIFIYLDETEIKMRRIANKIIEYHDYISINQQDNITQDTLNELELRSWVDMHDIINNVLDDFKIILGILDYYFDIKKSVGDNNLTFIETSDIETLVSDDDIETDKIINKTLGCSIIPNSDDEKISSLVDVLVEFASAVNGLKHGSIKLLYSNKYHALCDSTFFKYKEIKKISDCGRRISENIKLIGQIKCEILVPLCLDILNYINDNSENDNMEQVDSHFEYLFTQEKEYAINIVDLQTLLSKISSTLHGHKKLVTDFRCLQAVDLNDLLGKAYGPDYMNLLMASGLSEGEKYSKQHVEITSKYEQLISSNHRNHRNLKTYYLKFMKDVQKLVIQNLFAMDMKNDMENILVRYMTSKENKNIVCNNSDA